VTGQIIDILFSCQNLITIITELACDEIKGSITESYNCTRKEHFACAHTRLFSRPSMTNNNLSAIWVVARIIPFCVLPFFMMSEAKVFLKLITVDHTPNFMTLPLSGTKIMTRGLFKRLKEFTSMVC